MAEISNTENTQFTKNSLKEKLKKEQCKPSQKSRQHGLMTKLGKSDLLRLLSILEGELEARDIFITDLQANINHDKHIKQRYFQHGISDPFLALMRDNEALSGSVTSNQAKSFHKSVDNDNVRIEPLPLLEKVVTECKRQQVKVQQHIALSDAYYKLVNSELKEVKRKHNSASNCESDTLNTLEKEHEKLKIELQAERAKSRKMAVEYKNLLQAISKERHRFQIILTMLLEDRKINKDEVNTDDESSVVDSHDKYEELAERNRDLESVICHLKQHETVMKDEIDNLKQQLNAVYRKPNTSSGAEFDKSYNTNGLNYKDANLLVNCNTEDEMSEESYSTCIPHYSNCSKTNSVVSVKRTCSLIENRKLAEKFPIGSVLYQSTGSLNNTKVPNAKDNNALLEDSSKPQSVGNPPFRSTELRLKLSSSSIVSSPTSGAANFALNSPNLPPSSLPFSSPVVPAKAQRPASTGVVSFQATRQKFQRITKPLPSNLSTKSNDKLSATSSYGNRSVKHRADATDNAAPPPSLRNDGAETSSKKLKDSVVYKPQPPKPPKAKPSDSESPELTPQVRPPPLPPKKPSLISKHNSGKTTPNRQSRDHEGSKKMVNSQTGVGSRVSSPKTSSNISAKPVVYSHGTNKSSIKRPSSLNTNNNNNFNPRSSGRFSKPGSKPAPLALSAQHRLFPPQDGADGQLRSPVTNTVPKSPLDPCLFTFK